MSHGRAWTAWFLGAVALVGCAKTPGPRRDPPATGEASEIASAPTTQRLLTLDAVHFPRPTNATLLVDPAATTATAPARPPVEALALYARARAALAGNRRQAAIQALEEAIRLDPQSSTLHEELGMALRGRDAARSLAVLERAIELDPGNFKLHLELARQYLGGNELDRAGWHLLRARRSPEYGRSDGDAAAVDLLLGRTLQSRGFELAALECYTSLLERLRRPDFTFRLRPELAALTQQPEVVLVEIARLQESLGRPADALRSMEEVARRRGADRSVRARIALLQAKSGQSEPAISGAMALLEETGAARDATELVQEVFAALGRSDALKDELQARAKGPRGAAYQLALLRVLRVQRDAAAIDAVLEQALAAERPDPRLFGEIVGAYRDIGRPQSAVAAIVRALAAQSLPVAPLLNHLEVLLDPRGVPRVHVEDLKPGLPESARAYVQFLVLQSRQRPLAAHNALDRALNADPILPVVFRGAYLQALSSLRDEPLRARIEELQALAERRGAAGIAAELRGLVALREGRHADAERHFAAAVELGNDDPVVLMQQVAACRGAAENARAESLLWKIAGDHPEHDAAWTVLFETAVAQRNGQQALMTLRRWLSANPSSAAARLRQAALAVQAQQADQAEQILRSLFDEFDRQPELILGVVAVLRQAGREATALDWLEARRKEQPDNLVLIGVLVELLGGQQRTDEALRVVDAARAAMADSADGLYVVAGLYARLDRALLAHEALRQVLRLDPRHASAANDLGYSLADEGGDLEEAERLVRIAVEQEPDTPAYLDSLGWVLYKRGRFEQAEPLLARAIEIDTAPDPVVLDHLADVRWRLGRRDEAVAAWKRAIELLERQPNREPSLKLKIQGKLRAVDSGGSVEVAPVAK